MPAVSGASPGRAAAGIAAGGSSGGLSSTLRPDVHEEGDSGDVSTVGTAAGAGEGASEAGL